MIDIENDVFEVVKSTVNEYFPSAIVAGQYDELSNTFPAVTVAEVDNRVFERMRTDNIENAAIVTYEISVYSNRVIARKSEAKQIMNRIDSVMSHYGFTRVMKSQVPNLVDSKVFRLLARYSAAVGPNIDPDNPGKQFLIYQNGT